MLDIDDAIQATTLVKSRPLGDGDDGAVCDRSALTAPSVES